LNGEDVVTLEAVPTTMYEDEGATCSDVYDGQINSAVAVNGGNFPELSTPAVYAIEYHCTNSRGISATTLTRTVTVTDTTCPTCTLKGPVLPDGSIDATAEIEASFPYTDQGADCTDTLDGALAAHEVGLEQINVESTGQYTITYTATDSSGNTNVGCTHGYNAASHLTVRTVVVIDTLKPVIGLQYAGSVFHIGDTSDTGKNGETNPAHSRFNLGSPALMEIPSTGNTAWLFASVLCAVAGVSMLAQQMRRESPDLVV
jgi:hypothetical protein